MSTRPTFLEKVEHKANFLEKVEFYKPTFSKKLKFYIIFKNNSTSASFGAVELGAVELATAKLFESKKDFSSALLHYMAAAELGNSEANFVVGEAYDDEGRMQTDYAEAAKYYRRAVEGNHSLAMLNLAMLYKNGNGVVQNIQEAALLYARVIKKEVAEA